MGLAESVHLQTNAPAAKWVWGVGTIIIGLVLVSSFGALAASLIIAAGMLLFFGSKPGLRQLSIRGIVLQIGYWTLVVFGVGLGVQ